MLFNSFEFLLFFPIVTILYFLLPLKGRLSLLLVASCFFYMFFKPEYILILGFTIVIDYYAGILLERETDPKLKKRYLIMSLIANIGVLAIFKYYNFINENITGVASLLGYKNPIPFLAIALPIGLSFHTFQAMSYTIEVYHGNQKAERNFGIYALYVMFYPQLVAGPIERPQNILHQFYIKHDFNYDDVTSGLRQMTWGLLKKTVVADRLAIVADTVYNNPQQHSALGLCIGTIFFAFQIYCDFSGYSDIALGTARVMGYKLMVNFNKPYRARSVADFWRRWHISLFSWLTDYIFTPLSIKMRDMGIYAVIIASMITFLISGLWHGAAWTYVFFGVMHGVAVAYEILTRKFWKKFFKQTPKWVSNTIYRVVTLTFLWYTFIFFRANSFADAVYIAKKIPHVVLEGFAGLQNYHIVTRQLLAGLNIITVLTGFGIIFLLELLHKIEGENNLYEMIAKKPTTARWAVYIVCFILIAYFGVFDDRQFIYFQF